MAEKRRDTPHPGKIWPASKSRFRADYRFKSTGIQITVDSKDLNKPGWLGKEPLAQSDRDYEKEKALSDFRDDPAIDNLGPVDENATNDLVKTNKPVDMEQSVNYRYRPVLDTPAQHLARRAAADADNRWRNGLAEVPERDPITVSPSLQEKAGLNTAYMETPKARPDNRSEAVVLFAKRFRQPPRTPTKAQRKQTAGKSPSKSPGKSPNKRPGKFPKRKQVNFKVTPSKKAKAEIQQETDSDESDCTVPK